LDCISGKVSLNALTLAAGVARVTMPATKHCMVFRIHPPAAPLSHYVEMLWYYSGKGPPHRMERVLPDGTAELIVNLDEIPRKRFDRRDPALNPRARRRS
jgi:hypothetical protein